MASFDERVERLVAAGTITPKQGEEMRASIRALRKTTLESPRRKWVLGLSIGIGCILLIAVVSLFGLGGGEPETIQKVSEVMNEVGEVGKMNKGMTTGMSLFVILLPLLLSGVGFVWLYNDLVGKEEEVLASWSQVESNYQRRLDLVPNLVETVKGFVSHEEKVLVEVTQSRQKAMEAMQGMGEKLEDEAALSEMDRAQQALGAGITRLFGLAENYPQLRSADNFLALQDQLEGTENRINAARMVFNESVRDYNGAIRRMPGTMIAGMGGFKRKAYFEAGQGAGDPAKVDF